MITLNHIGYALFLGVILVGAAYLAYLYWKARPIPDKTYSWDKETGLLPHQRYMAALGHAYHIPTRHRIRLCIAILKDTDRLSPLVQAAIQNLEDFENQL